MSIGGGRAGRIEAPAGATGCGELLHPAALLSGALLSGALLESTPWFARSWFARSWAARSGRLCSPAVQRRFSRARPAPEPPAVPPRAADARPPPAPAARPPRAGAPPGRPLPRRGDPVLFDGPCRGAAGAASPRSRRSRTSRSSRVRAGARRPQGRWRAGQCRFPGRRRQGPRQARPMEGAEPVQLRGGFTLRRASRGHRASGS